MLSKRYPSGWECHFLNDDIAHTQYISGDENRKDGSLDFLMHQTILKFNKTKKFSFGSSSEKNGTKS